MCGEGRGGVGASDTCGRKKGGGVPTGCAHGILKVRVYLEDLSVDVNVILKWDWSIKHGLDLSAFKTSDWLL
jgi:hypothetical protein